MNKPERSEGLSAGTMWVSGMSGASEANPEEGAQRPTKLYWVLGEVPKAPYLPSSMSERRPH